MFRIYSHGKARSGSSLPSARPAFMMNTFPFPTLPFPIDLEFLSVINRASSKTTILYSIQYSQVLFSTWSTARWKTRVIKTLNLPKTTRHCFPTLHHRIEMLFQGTLCWYLQFWSQLHLSVSSDLVLGLDVDGLPIPMTSAPATFSTIVSCCHSWSFNLKYGANYACSPYFERSRYDVAHRPLQRLST